MHVVLTRATIHDLEQADQTLTDEGIERIKQMPGFVSAQWFAISESQGGVVITFETEENAKAAAEQVRANPAAGSAVTLDSIEVAEVIGSA